MNYQNKDLDLELSLLDNNPDIINLTSNTNSPVSVNSKDTLEIPEYILDDEKEKRILDTFSEEDQYPYAAIEPSDREIANFVLSRLSKPNKKKMIQTKPRKYIRSKDGNFIKASKINVKNVPLGGYNDEERRLIQEIHRENSKKERTNLTRKLQASLNKRYKRIQKTKKGGKSKTRKNKYRQSKTEKSKKHRYSNRTRRNKKNKY